MALLPENAATALQYSRAEFWSEPYRMVAGHWLHIDGMHLAANAIVLALLSLLLSQYRARWFLFLLVVPVFISLGLFYFAAEVKWYRGLSGVLHGAVVWYAIAALRGTWRWLLLAGMLVKLGVEQFLPVAFDFQVIYAAHWMGAVAGGVWGLLYMHIDYLRRQATNARSKSCF